MQTHQNTGFTEFRKIVGKEGVRKIIWSALEPSDRSTKAKSEMEKMLAQVLKVAKMGYNNIGNTNIPHCSDKYLHRGIGTKKSENVGGK